MKKINFSLFSDQVLGKFRMIQELKESTNDSFQDEEKMILSPFSQDFVNLFQKLMCEFKFDFLNDIFHKPIVENDFIPHVFEFIDYYDIDSELWLNDLAEFLSNVDENNTILFCKIIFHSLSLYKNTEEEGNGNLNQGNDFPIETVVKGSVKTLWDQISSSQWIKQTELIV